MAKIIADSLGTLNCVRRFIDGYAEITAPLVELTI